MTSDRDNIVIHIEVGGLLGTGRFFRRGIGS